MIRTFAVVICAVLLAGACAGSEEISGERRNVGGVTVTFKAEPAHAKAGQAVRLTIRLVNNSGRKTELTYPSAQRYDFWVTRGSKEVWRWSEGQVFTQETTRETIEGQSGTSFSQAWPSEAPGTYVAHGVLTAEGYPDDLQGKIEVG
jgi:hypothetical protein